MRVGGESGVDRDWQISPGITRRARADAGGNESSRRCAFPVFLLADDRATSCAGRSEPVSTPHLQNFVTAMKAKFPSTKAGARVGRVERTMPTRIGHMNHVDHAE